MKTSIRIKNIYYMLAYAFDILRESSFQGLAEEEFPSAMELCAAILERGTAVLIKRGLGRDYIPRQDAVSALKGRIVIGDSIKTQTQLRGQMVCVYDEFSENYILNQILKTTMSWVVRKDITAVRKISLRKLLVFFEGVDEIDLYSVNWNQQFNRNNQVYRLLIYICHLLFKSRIQSPDGKAVEMLGFTEDRLHNLYEKFILNYYKREFSGVTGFTSRALRINWQVDDGYDELLPSMRTDITLDYEDRILIIDAKHYERTMQVSQFGKHTLHSSNLYQIFTYVKNKEEELRRQGIEKQVMGMLLYAKTDEELWPDNDYSISGNKIMVKTLDLNVDFSLIKSTLDGIADKYLGAVRVSA